MPANESTAYSFSDLFRNRLAIFFRCLASLFVIFSCGALLAETPPKTFRIISYNVEFGRSTTPEALAEALREKKPDIICLNEVPGGDWSEKVGKELKMPYTYTGKISSANHVNKYKSIISRTPLEEKEEYSLDAIGWTPVSAVRAVTAINGVKISIYSLHVPGEGTKENSAVTRLVKEYACKDKTPLVVMAGDFNLAYDHPEQADLLKVIETNGFRGVWSDLPQVNLTKDFTWNAFEKTSTTGVIDHIFYTSRSGAKVVDGGIFILKKPLSDHHPIWAEFQSAAANP